MSDRLYLTPDQVQQDSYLLAAKVLESGFRPDILVAFQRGGLTIGVHIHEFFRYCGLNTLFHVQPANGYDEHDRKLSDVAITNIDVLVRQLQSDSKILAVDDISDSGETYQAFLDALREHAGPAFPKEIQLAVLYYKPASNMTGSPPEHYLHATNQWVVFPHELPKEASLEELTQERGHTLMDLLLRFRRPL